MAVWILISLLLIPQQQIPERAVKYFIPQYLMKSYAERQVVLRSLNQFTNFYYEFNGNLYYFRLAQENRFAHSLKTDESVTIKTITGEGDMLYVHFEGETGPGTMVFSSPAHSPVIDHESFAVGFDICFRAPDSPDTLARYVGNTSSRLVHSAGANHLPVENLRVKYDTVERAKAAGFEQCRLCFMQSPVVSDYITERRLGHYTAQQIRSIGQVAPDEALQNRATEIGQRVLEGWPVPLQGYEYRFFVLDDMAVNAYAAPTGFIYVNRGLLEVAESDLEIEGILAHEIAHVERRHGYRIYRSQRKKAIIAGIVGAAVGGVVGAKISGEAGIMIGGLSTALVSMVINAIYEGYPRSMEEEADAMAALYINQRSGDKGKAAMVMVLKKLRYYGDAIGVNNTALQSFQSHPLLDDRIATFENSSIERLSPPVVILGMDGDVEAFRIELTTERITTPEVVQRYKLDRVQLLGQAYASARIKEPRKLHDVSFSLLNGTVVIFDNKEDSLIAPYEEEGFILRGNTHVDFSQVRGVTVNLEGVKLDWILQ